MRSTGLLTTNSVVGKKGQSSLKERLCWRCGTASRRGRKPLGMTSSVLLATKNVCNEFEMAASKQLQRKKDHLPTSRFLAQPGNHLVLFIYLLIQLDINPFSCKNKPVPVLQNGVYSPPTVTAHAHCALLQTQPTDATIFVTF